MFEEISKSISASFNDRITSPLFGTFVISWSIWNYKIFFVLFSDLPVFVKFVFIDYVLYDRSGHLDWWVLIVFPLISSLGFLLLYPFPAKWVFIFWRTQQNELKKIRQRIDDETPLTMEESRELRSSYEKSIDAFRVDLTRKDHDISSLTRKLDEEQKKSKSLEDSLARIPSRTTKSKRKITDVEIMSYILGRKLVLHYDPPNKSTKSITFSSNGEITDGKNENENTWRVAKGKLEILNDKGKVFSRFYFLPNEKMFKHTNDQDTLSKRDQFIS